MSNFEYGSETFRTKLQIFFVTQFRIETCMSQEKGHQIWKFPDILVSIERSQFE